MNTRSFWQFTAPSLAVMLALLGLPLIMTMWLSVRDCTPQLELVRVQQTGPFGAQEVVTQRSVLGANGRPLENCRFVGAAYYRKLLGLGAAPASPDASVGSAGSAGAAESHNEYFAALRFTLLYTLATTPFVLGGGLLLALAVNAATQHLKAGLIAASLLPFIITPVVGALAIKWLFRDNGLVPQLLAQVGVQVFWLAQAWSARLLIVLYGIWHVLPFAFNVFYAGLQSVPQDSIEADKLDGASAWQRLRHVTLPHLAPLLAFVALIHLMDAYRVFEPVLVLTQGAFTTSLQVLSYDILINENNPYKASAAALVTLLGMAVLLAPLLRKTWREQRQGR